MKIIKIAALFFALALSSLPAFAEDKNICDVAAEARNGEVVSDLDSVNSFVVCKRNAVLQYIYVLSPSAFEHPLMKLTASILEIDTSLYPKQSIDINRDLIIAFARFMLGFIASALLVLAGYRLYKIMSIKGAEDKSNELRSMVYTSIALVVIGGVFLTGSIFPVFGSIVLFLTAAIGMTIAETLIKISSFNPNKNIEDKIESEFLSSYNKTPELILNFTQAELSTKYATLSAKGYEMTKNDFGGFLDSDSTKRDILLNIENNQILNIVPVVESSGVVEKVELVWNKDFEDYDEDKYGLDNKPFSFTMNNTLESLEESVDDADKISEMTAKGQSDAAGFLSSGNILSILNKFKSESLENLKLDKPKDISKKADLAVVNAIKDNFKSRYEAIEKELKMNGHKGTELSILLSSYTNGYVSGLEGYNADSTFFKAAMYLGRSAAISQREFNCSLRYKNNSTSRLYAEDLNSKNGLWADLYETALKINTQCMISENGVVRVAGVDKETQAEQMNQFKYDSIATASALNRYYSHISEGVFRAYGELNKDGNEYTAAILKHIDEGALGLSNLRSQLGKINKKEQLNGSIIFNNSSSNYLGSMSNDLYVDYVKLFGEKDIKDINSSEQYSSISDHYEPLIVSGLISESNAKLTSAQMIVAESSDTGAIDSFSAMIQNQIGSLNEFKEFLGLSPEKSFASGIREREESDAYLSRRSGTISDAMDIAAGYLEVGLTIVAMLSLVDALDTVKDLGQLVEIVGFDSTKGPGAFAAKALGLLGTVASVIIDVIQAISNVLWNFAYLLIFMGFYVGYWIPAIMIASLITIEIVLGSLPVLLSVFFIVYAVRYSLGMNITAMKTFVNIVAGALSENYFRVVGFLMFFMIICFLPVGSSLYVVFSSFYSSNPLFMILSLSLTLLMAAVIFNSVKAIIEYTTDKGRMLFKGGSSLYDSGTDSDLASVAQAKFADDLVNKSLKNSSDALSKAIRDKAKASGSEEPSEPIKPSTSVNGLK
ncbi:hypothetical protein [Pseudomonas aeruginosa]|uniref:hypothetical protein n=1 Tax=Pseudomonas aeruginosa TaxID=287 RepID=UPI0010494610|nr:hypothetical protein [Pseudomonas aeruginosa]